MSARPLRLAASATSTLALVAAGLAATTVAAHAAPGDVNTDLCVGTPVWTGDLTPGQQVTGRTTVEGNALDDFEGTYVDTIDDAYGNDIHLFDLSGSRITGGHGGQGPAGIWSGISGSPVYDLEGNLVGSVSYSFTGYAGSTLAGVTPAENIFNADPTQAAPAPVRLAASEKATLKKAGVEGASKLEQAKPLRPVRVVTGNEADKANDLAAKSQVLKSSSGARSGATYRAASTISAAAEDALPPIEAGGNIATSYSHGQITFASIGTVTAVCGDQVYAFGHPDEDTGESTQTILKAKTLAIVSDGPASYKMANVGTAPAGSLTSDNTNGIRGTLGTTPESTPVTTHTTANGSTVDRVTQVSTPYALSAVVANQMGNDAYNAFKRNGAGDALSTLTVDFVRSGSSRTERYRRTFRLSTSSYFADEVAFAAASDVETILSNQFEDVRVTSVDVATTYKKDYRAYKINGLQYRKSGIWRNVGSNGIPTRKGETLRLRVKLKADRGSTVAPATLDTLWKTSGSSKQSGRFTFYGQSFASSYEDEEFFEDEEDYEEEEGYELESLDELLELMRLQPRADQVLGRYHFNTKAGRQDRFRTLRADAIVSGTATARLRYSK